MSYRVGRNQAGGDCHKHVLQHIDLKREWNCTDCKRNLVNQRSFYCKNCRYILCPLCHSVKKEERGPDEYSTDWSIPTHSDTSSVGKNQTIRRGKVRVANITRPRQDDFDRKMRVEVTRPSKDDFDPRVRIEVTRPSKDGFDREDDVYTFTAYSDPDFAIGTIDNDNAYIVNGRKQGFKICSPGLDGTPRSVSFECLTKRGHYLRHQNSFMRLDPYSNELDRKYMCDATFFIRQNAFSPGCVAIESCNQPTYFLCHENYRMMLLPIKYSESYLKNASFIRNTYDPPRTINSANLPRTVISPPHDLPRTVISPPHEKFAGMYRTRLDEDAIRNKESYDLERRQVERLKKSILEPPRILTLKSRNKCLVISNKFAGRGDGELSGYEHDERSILSTFKTLNFDVILKTDLTAAQMKKEFIQVRETKFVEEECFATFILSHGETNRKIKGCDDRLIDLDFIIDKLSECVSLYGKPKLIFVQACRGDEAGEVIEVMRNTGATGAKMTSTRTSAADKKSEVVTQSKDADTLVYYATTEGRYSYVCAETGSFFIQAVCKVFNAYWRKYPLSGIITKINEIVASHIVASPCGREVYVEACEVSHRLTCDIFFSSNRIPSPSIASPDDAREITTPEIDNQRTNEPVIYQIKKLENIVGKVIKHVFPDGRLPLSDCGTDTEPNNYNSFKKTRSDYDRSIIHAAHGYVSDEQTGKSQAETNRGWADKQSNTHDKSLNKMIDDGYHVTYSDENKVVLVKGENYPSDLVETVRVVGEDDDIYAKKVHNENDASKETYDVRVNMDMESLNLELEEVQKKIEENKRLIMIAAKRICR